MVDRDDRVEQYGEIEMQTVEHKSKKSWDTDALLELPEMRETLAEFRATQEEFRTELWIAFLECEDDELPDVRPLNQKYDSRLRELKNRVRAIAKAHQG